MPRAVRYSAPDRRRQILEVARELFARQGFQGTTTRAIARQAGVTEALIFRHFPTKEALYWALLEHTCQAARAREQLQERLHDIRDDRELFATIAEDILKRNTGDPGRARLMLYSALENHRLAGRFFHVHFEEFYEALARHVARRMRQGHFRRTDPRLAARGFVGMVIYHYLVQELFGGKRYRRFSDAQVSRTLADIWLAGMERNGCDAPRRPTSKKN